MRKLIILVTYFLLAVPVLAASDAARVAGDLKINGIHFSGDGSTMYSANDMLRNKGSWEYGKTYSTGDVVQSQGSSYVCTTANTNIMPPDAPYWSVLAAQGPTSNLSNYYTKTEIDARIASVASQIPAQSAAPANPVSGQMYFDTVTNSPMIYNGSMWLPLSRNISYFTAIYPDETDDGYIAYRSLLFNKLMPTSRLRITWSDNLRVTGSYASCQWEVLVDDVATSPQLKTSLYVDSGLMHRQSTLIGYANGVGAGSHTIKIKVSRPLTPAANCYTGWESTFLLEAEEIY